MLKISLEVLKKIESNGFEAYIVGGFVRDQYLRIKSDDVDICTNAKPKDLLKIFTNAVLPKEKYGAVTLFHKKIRFEITTFRKEIKYLNRKPIDIKYTNDFNEDIYRRDFTVNTLCINSQGKVIDILNGKKDIDNKIIKVVGDINKKFYEDPLRILRAVRFATQLNFKIDDDVKEGIINNGKYLKDISYTRKKEELVRILLNKNVCYGIQLIKELGLDIPLEIKNIESIIVTDDILGMLAQLDILNIYPFSKNEKESIISIKNIIKKDSIDNKDLYKYGLYICLIAADILRLNKKDLVIREKKLPIKTIKDINITPNEISAILDKPLNEWIREVLFDLENKILNNNINNNKRDIKKYILENYGGRYE